jgi:hypothetical protein
LRIADCGLKNKEGLGDCGLFRLLIVDCGLLIVDLPVAD